MTADGRRRPGSEAGFTLVELLVATVIGMIVVLAALALLDSSVTVSSRVHERVDSNQRARVAMERITTQLRSQVCMAPGTPAIVDGQDYSVTFYTFTGQGPLAPERHTISWDTNANSIVEQDYKGTGTSPNMTYPATPTRTWKLLTDVQPVFNVPVFRYYAYDTGPTPGPTIQLPTPLSAADRARVVRIAVGFVTQPSGRTASKEATTLQNDVYVRTADPNSTGTAPAPMCG